LASSFVNLLVVFGLGVVILIDRPLHLPEVLRERLETRLERFWPDHDLRLGSLDFTVAHGWRPSLRLHDLVVFGPRGERLAQVSDLQVSLSLHPLLKGQVQPKEIWLAGAYGLVRRDASGAMALSVGEQGNGAGEIVSVAPNLPNLLRSWDAVFARPQFAALRSVSLQSLTVRVEDPVRGWFGTFDGGWMTVDRRGDELTVGSGFSLLSGGSAATSVEVHYNSHLKSPEAQFRFEITDMAAQDLAAQTPALEWLKVLRAPISGALEIGVTPEGELTDMVASLEMSQGEVQPTPEVRPIKFNSVDAELRFSPANETLRFDRLQIDSPVLSATAQGVVAIGLLPDQFSLSDLTGQIAVSEIRFDPLGLLPKPLTIPAIAGDVQLKLDPFQLTLAGGHVEIDDSVVAMAAKLTSNDQGWNLSADVALDQITPENLITYWPEGVAKGARKWVAANLRDGVIRDVDLALRSRPGLPPQISGDFGFSDMTIGFVRHMPPITHAFGQASLHDGRFVATALRGSVVMPEHGSLNIAGTSFAIPDISIRRRAPADVDLVIESTVPAVMEILNRKPISVLRNGRLPVALAQGGVRATGRLSLPLAPKVPFDEIRFSVMGELRDVSSDVLLPGQVLTSDRLILRGDQRGIEISGSGAVGALPVDVVWAQPIGPGKQPPRLTGRAELSPLADETFDIGLPAGVLTGRGWADVDLRFDGEHPLLTVTSDLRSVGLAVAPLGWRHRAADTGDLLLIARLGPNPKVQTLSLRASDLTLEGEVSLKPSGTGSGKGLDQAELSTLRIGDWLDVQGRLIGRGSGNILDIEVSSGHMDLRGFSPTPTTSATGVTGEQVGEQVGERAGALTVQLDRLSVSKTIWLDQFSGKFSTIGGLDGPFNGQLNGSVAMTGDLRPSPFGPQITANSNDAGAVLAALNILRRAEGGGFELALSPSTDDPTRLEGQARVTDLRVRDAPTLGALLNAISVVGLLSEMMGQGLQFSEVDAEFGISQTGLIDLYSASAIGASVGLSANGQIESSSGRVDLQGVISPIYVLNGFGSVISGKGEGVLGFNYTLRGDVGVPRVSVNPLSILAPSFLREVFRARPAPKPPSGARQLLPDLEPANQGRQPGEPSRGEDR
jgi:hypothetical protein